MHVYVRRAYFNTRFDSCKFAKFCSNDSQRRGVEKNAHEEGMQMWRILIINMTWQLHYLVDVLYTGFQRLSADLILLMPHLFAFHLNLLTSSGKDVWRKRAHSRPLPHLEKF